MGNVHNKNDKIHVIYLSKEASYQNLENDTLVMGFYDNFTEIFRKNVNGDGKNENREEQIGNDAGKNGSTDEIPGNTVDKIDYLAAFGIHTPSFLATKHLTAKQLFTLVEFENALECHYQKKNLDDASIEEWRFFHENDSAKPDQAPPHFGQKIIPEGINPAYSVSGDLPDGAKYPAFIGVILVSLDYFQPNRKHTSTESGYIDYHDQIRKKLQEFIKNARSEEEIPTSAGEISRYAEIRMFQCTNCSDLCFTVSTIRLLDILLVSKAVQICVKEKSRAQFSPVWSFVTVPTRALEEPENIQNSRDPNGKSITPFDKYIKTVVAANSYRRNREDFDENQAHDNEAITVDFRLSFHDFDEERNFLRELKNPQEVEGENKEVDDVYRVAGVLGNGSYSVHLPFHEYLELFRFKYLHKQTLLGNQEDLKRKQPHLNYLIAAITGRKEYIKNDSEQQKFGKVDISYQRIRFCYVGHLFQSSDDKRSETKFFKAEKEILKAEKANSKAEEESSKAEKENPKAEEENPKAEEENPKAEEENPKAEEENLKAEEEILNEEKVSYNPGEGNGGKIEALIYRLLNYLSTYRNRISSNEYRFREAVYLAKDLVYTYNDLFARGNLKTVIFITQVFAMLRDTELYCERFTKESVGRTGARRLVQEVTENLRLACLALNRYSHEAVMNAGNNFNTQTYEIQSKVNIEKYIVAYSVFMQEIFKDYSRERKNHKHLCKRLYPFVYLDIEEKKILMYTLFRRLKMTDQYYASPVLLAVAVPNYRRFANIYRILPQLVHEIAHQFIYDVDHSPREYSELEKAEEYLPDDYSKENNFVLEKGAEYLADMLAKEFCGIAEAQEDKNLGKVQKDLAKRFTTVLVNHLEEFGGKKILSETGREFLQERVLQYYVRKYVKVYSTFANKMVSFWGYKKDEKLEWEPLEGLLQKLAGSLNLRWNFVYEELMDKWKWAENCSDYAQILLSSLFGIIREVARNDATSTEKYVNIIANTLARQTICIYQIDEEKEASEKFREQIIAEIMQGIRIKVREEYVGKNSCLAVTVHKQIFIDILSAVMLAGIEQLGEFCPLIDADSNVDPKLENMVIDLYSAGNGPDIREIFENISSYINSTTDTALYDSGIQKEMKIIENQVETYCTILYYIAGTKTLRFYPLEKECDSINFRLSEAVWELTVDYAKEKTPELRSHKQIDLLNGFSDKSETRKRINRMLGFLGTDGYIKAMYAYANVHSEVCADLGMCAAFGFNAFGYLVFQSNLHIDHMENEDMIEDNLVEEPAEHYAFRNRKYLEVLKTLSDLEGEQKNLVEETLEMLEVLRKQIREVYLPELRKYAKEIWNVEGTQLEKLCGISKDIKNFSQIPNNVQLLINGLNNIGMAIRQVIASAPENEQSDHVIKRVGEEVEQELDNYMHLADTISDYLRYARVINHICRALSDCKFNEFTKVEDPAPYYKKLYEEILKSEWVKNVKEGSNSLCLKIGRFYNESARKFNSSYSLEDQVSFVLEYYTKAHDSYQSLYQMLTKDIEWLKKNGSSEPENEQLWKKVDLWFDTFYN